MSSESCCEDRVVLKIGAIRTSFAKEADPRVMESGFEAESDGAQAHVPHSLTLALRTFSAHRNCVFHVDRHAQDLPAFLYMGHGVRTTPPDDPL